MARPKRTTEEKIYATSKDILTLLAAGALLAVVFTSPEGGARILQELITKGSASLWDKYDQRRLKQSIKRMTDRKLLEVRQSGNETEVVVSKKGKKVLLKYNFQEMILDKTKKWDGRWRVVAFDVGEEKKSKRDSLRDKMRSLGFYQLQKSVFVTPYQCENEIAFLREYFEIGNNVSYFITVDLEEEEFLKKQFRLG